MKSLIFARLLLVYSMRFIVYLLADIGFQACCGLRMINMVGACVFDSSGRHITYAFHRLRCFGFTIDLFCDDYFRCLWTLRD